MKKLNYLITTSGKFHYFEIAKILNERNQLSKIVTGYPWFKLKNEKLPKKIVESSGLYQIINYFLHRIPKINLNKLINTIDYINKKKIDHATLQQIFNADVLISSVQSGMIAGKKAKELNKIYMCDQSSAHILFEDNLISEELELLNLKRKIFLDERIKERALEEYNDSDFILVPSNYVKSTFNNHYHSKIFVNNFGINTKNFYPIENHKKNNDSFNIIYIGGVSIRKGIHYLIDAFNKLKYSNKKLHLIGDHINNDKEFLKRKINQENIIVYGHVHHLKLNKILNDCHVFVTATLSDGYANVVNQAIASGCPVIITENTGAKEYVEQNKCGYVVPIRNSEKIYEKLNLLLDDKDLLNNLSENSKNSSKENTWVNYVDRLDAFINKNKKII